jgi:AcrR family transcriptional regulator
MRATSPRRLRADAERNLGRILDAAGEVFATRGFDATLHDVAAHAGLGVGTVYRRFPDKQALVEALFSTRLDQVLSTAEEAASQRDPWQALVGVLEVFTGELAGDHGLHQILHSDAYAAECSAVARDRLQPLFDELLARAHASGDLRADVEPGDIPMIMMMVSSVAQQMRSVNPMISRRYLELLVDGLRARPGQLPLSAPAPTLKQVEAAKLAERPKT